MSEQEIESNIETIQDKLSKWIGFAKLTGGMLVAFIAFTLTVGATYSKFVYDIKGLESRMSKNELEWSIERQGLQADVAKLRAEISDLKAGISQVNGKMDVVLQRVK